jgi:trigger factor
MSHIEYPPILVEQELERLLAAYRERLGGERGVQDYLKFSGKGEEEFKDELQARAEKIVRRSLILDKVREVENIEVSEAEVDAEVESLALGAKENRDRVRELFSMPSARDSLRGELAMKKAMERLIQIATAAPDEGEAELSGGEG